MSKKPQLLKFTRTPEYERQLSRIVSNSEERDSVERAFEETICENPEAGDLVKGTGGVRKLRVALPGRGKRGSARLIYFYVDQAGVVYLITLYAKNVSENLSESGKRQIKAEVKKLEEDV